MCLKDNKTKIFIKEMIKITRYLNSLAYLLVPAGTNMGLHFQLVFLFTVLAKRIVYKRTRDITGTALEIAKVYASHDTGVPYCFTYPSVLSLINRFVPIGSLTNPLLLCVNPIGVIYSIPPYVFPLSQFRYSLTFPRTVYTFVPRLQKYIYIYRTSFLNKVVGNSCYSSRPKLEETTNILTHLFGPKKTLFRRRFDCLKIANQNEDGSKRRNLQTIQPVSYVRWTKNSTRKTNNLRQELSHHLIAALIVGTIITGINVRHGTEETRRFPKRKWKKQHDRYQCKYVITSLTQENQPHLEVTINGKLNKLLLDTGAEISLFKRSTWKQLGKPAIQQTPVNYAGTCYVNDDCDIVGMKWISQVPDLATTVDNFQVHKTYTICLYDMLYLLQMMV
uniref:RVP domain-containing protein n=1 Tax=Heterorhabditis bacteriophora TaxID=37862 RepID=A0A1I7WLW1_HETBA